MNRQIKKIRVIEVNKEFLFLPDEDKKKIKVCAYARVSTDEEDQLNSFDNQINEYQDRINNNPEWKFAGMYADKGMSGTQIKKREQFIKMIEDAKARKFSLILTKSISRFGRNTVDVLTTVRELREYGVTVFFEKENLYSDDTKLDFILTIMSSVAQEESRNISENIKWSVTKRFKEGKVIMNTSNFLGYTKDKDGHLTIVPNEAQIIKDIFNLYLQGHSAYDISKILMKEQIKTGANKSKWNTNSVLRILQNEKYAGDAILQKTYTVDYLTHKSVPNDNIVDKYFIEGNHEPIVSKEIFDVVAEKIKKEYTTSIDTSKNSKYPLTNLVYCMTCSRAMKRHYHNFGRKSEKVVLNCNHAPKIKVNMKCNQKVIDNDLVLAALNDVIKDLGHTDELNKLIIDTLTSSLDYNKSKDKVRKLNHELEIAKDSLENLISENVGTERIDTSAFNRAYNEQKLTITKLNLELSNINYKISNSITNESRLKTIKKFFNEGVFFEESLIIKSLFKLILVTKDNDLIIVLNGDNRCTSEILNDYSTLDSYKTIIDKTYFVKKLNKNVTYKVVISND